ECVLIVFTSITACGSSESSTSDASTSSGADGGLAGHDAGTGQMGMDAGGSGGGCTGAVQGSCLDMAHNECTEWSGQDSQTSGFMMMDCRSPKVYAAGACDKTSAVGACQRMFTGCNTSWKFPPRTASFEKMNCESGGQGVWLNP